MRLLLLALLLQGDEHASNTWVKRTPGAGTPVSPRMGYEGDCVWYAKERVVLRYGGHNQGGGGEQGSEIWTLDPKTWTWTLREPDTSPPGVCCAQQNAYDPVRGRYLRFPSFSASHGWQWHREVYLNQSSVWSYDLGQNRWRNVRPFPAPSPGPLRCAAWDSDHDVVVLFGGEGCRDGTVVYDPWANEWTSMKPPKQPEFRSSGNLAYDAARKVHVLFGAQFTDDPFTWLYDLRKNEWRGLKPDPMPPTDKNDAVLTYDPFNEAVLAIVKVGEGDDENARRSLETWAYDAGKNEWTRMKPSTEPDASGNRARVLMFAPELNLAILENCTSKPREQQIWTYRYGAGKAPPPALTALSIATTADSATLSWTPVDRPLKVHRGTGDKPWTVDWKEIGEAKPGDSAYRDSGLKAGVLQWYRIESARVRSAPRTADDLRVSVLAKDRVELSWPPVADAVRYVVERAPVEVASDDQLRMLKSRTAPVGAVGALRRVGVFAAVGESTDPAYVDSSVDLSAPARVAGEPLWQRSFGKEAFDEAGKPYAFGVYAYRVRAVNALGVAGGPSETALTIPSAPRNVLCREEGPTAHVKWAGNPEKGLQGYRVYRMDGRFDKEPVSRLTPDPIRDATISDREAGKKSRRYYVIAVDALGQEGFPSSPAWFEREWKSFYKPFTAEWHQ